MPDAPDGYTYRGVAERHILGDLAELGVRLGSPVTYDRRGDVLWYDTFDRGVGAWHEDTLGNDGTVRVTADLPLIGGFACKLSSPSVGNVYIGMTRYLNPAVVNKWGVELAVAFTSIFDNFIISLDYMDGADAWYSAIKIDHDDAEVLYRTGATSYVKLCDIEIIPVATVMYHRFKLVADFANGNYQRILVNQNEYDVSTVSLHTGTPSLGPYSHINLLLTGNINNVRTVKVDSVIITANEP